MRVPDVTDVVPTRRMSVARGTLVGAGAPGLEALAAARVAAVLAMKDAARLVPGLAPFVATDAFCDLQETSRGLEATATVQAFARARLSSAALAGVAAALLSLLESAGHPAGARIEGLQVVQDVDG